MSLDIRAATPNDAPLILEFIQGLAEYERLREACIGTVEDVRETLFGDRAYAEVIIAALGGAPVGFALFFHNYSTFLARPGIYLEDLFVVPAARGAGVGKALLKRVAQIAVERRCGRFEWSVLDWNEPSIEFYKAMGARPMNEWTTFRVDGDALRKLAGD